MGRIVATALMPWLLSGVHLRFNMAEEVAV
jgi:hypothetical protein